MQKSDPGRSEQRLDHFAKVVRDAGVKVTHQRLEIFRELATTEQHPTAEAVFRAVQRRVPTVSLDTVYRTLWMLRDLGLVATLGTKGEGVRFDVNIDRHHHYVCMRCGLVRDFESRTLDGLRLPESVKALGSVVEAQVEVRGLCAECTPKMKTAKSSTKPAVTPQRTQRKKTS